MATASGVGGQAAPAVTGKQQPGAAAPAGNGATAGTPQSPSAEAALVEAKKQAEHWRKKYERDVNSANERLAKLEGLAQGIGSQQPAQPKPPARSIEEVDDSGFEAIVKRGIEENNPGFVTESMKEIARRQADAAAKAAEERQRDYFDRNMERQRVNAKIATEFGAEEVLNEDSELRQRADQYLAAIIRKDKTIIDRVPDVAYLCFAKAHQDLRAGEKTELEQLRRDRAEREAAEAIERSSRNFDKQVRDDVKSHLDAGDMKSAIKTRLDWITKRPARR